MRPHVISHACLRVRSALNDALAEGTLVLPAELAAHARQCATCGPAVAEVQELLGRLRSVPAGLPLGEVPAVVEAVLGRAEERHARRSVNIRWFLGQLAGLAVLLFVATCIILAVVTVGIRLIGGTGLFEVRPLLVSLVASATTSPWVDRDLFLWIYLNCIEHIRVTCARRRLAGCQPAV
ncbi:MAG TPA: hypothetical protein VNT75_08005 [Symbiobacteriaceae bacterium]|nr:hypothetical protein [Symbiobacteriaceae bacterium]